MTARTIGIISIKGGVGKTTAAVNLASTLADTGKKVLLVDADFSSPCVGLHLGIVSPKKTLSQVFKNQISAYEAVHSYTKNLDLLPSSLIADKINPYMLKEKLGSLKRLYDFVIIDSSPTLNDDMLSTMIASDELLVIASPDYPTLSATMYAIRIAKKQKTPISGLLLNKVRGKRFELSRKEIEEAAGVPVVGIVKDDVDIQASLAKSKPAIIHKPKSRSAKSFKKLASHFTGTSQPTLIERLVNRFK